MNCPYCGSQYLEESSNFNEYTCELCKCEFKQDGDTHRTFEEGNYKKFCENVMYKLCEDASPKLSNVLVSVISQLKNNGVEEIDTLLEHLQLVSANVSSEVAIGLNQESDLEVVAKGIEMFESLGNTLLKRDDLELDLSRLIRLKESKAFYESAYATTLPLVSVKPAGGNMQKSVVAGACEESAPAVSSETKTFKDIQAETAQTGVAAVLKLGDGIGSFSLIEDGQVVQGFDSVAQLKDYIGYYEVPMALYVKSGTGTFSKTAEGNPQKILKAITAKPKPVGEEINPTAPIEEIPREGGGLVGGVSDNLPGVEVDDPNEVEENSNPIDSPELNTHHNPNISDTERDPVGQEPVSPEDMEASFKPLDDEMLEALSNAMAEGYSSGAISEEADFAEALMNCEAANGLCENLGAMSEEDVYEIAKRTKAKLESMENVGAGIGMGEEASEEQLMEALEILSKSANKEIKEEELKDL